MSITPFLTVSPTFTTLSFWFLFACFYLVYLAVHRHLLIRNIYLLLISYTFAIMWDWRVPIVLIACTITSFFLAHWLPRIRSVRRKELVLSFIIAAYVGALVYCKYANFFLDTLNIFLRAYNFPSILTGLHVIVPLGFSFYIFQIISYIVDSSNGKQIPTRDFVSYALFLAFFPKFIAGPIERAEHFLPQLQKIHRIDRNHVTVGIFLIVWGLVQKVCIADNAAIYASYALLTPMQMSANTLTAWVAVPLQIFADFSGYTDIARGIASLLGFTLVRNFNMPYLATSSSDFWRRWHLSLSQWCRDYIFIPLGGSRAGFLFTLRNVMITMVVVGWWHGANWNYVVWGAFHGVLGCSYLLADRYASTRFWIVRFLRHKLVAGCTWFFFVSIGWIIFQNLSSVPFYELFFAMRFTLGKFFFLALALWLPIIGMHAIDIRAKSQESVARLPPVFFALFIVMSLYSILVFTPFKQFDFIYRQF